MTEQPRMQWTDANGRTWSTRLSLADARRLQTAANIDLLDPKQMADIFRGTLQIIEVIAELSRTQWESTLKYEEFVELLISTETSLATATKALQESLTDFFQRLGRSELAAVADRAWNAMAKAQAVRIEKANGMEVLRILDKGMAAELKDLDRELASVEKQLDQQLESGNGSSNYPRLADWTGDH